MLSFFIARMMKESRSRPAGHHREKVLDALDRLALQDRIAAMTTRAVSLESGISDGVLFRHFPNKERMLEAWLESRGEKMRAVLDAMPPGRAGLIWLIRRLLREDETLLAFQCCRAMDIPWMARWMDECREMFRQTLCMKIRLMGQERPEALCDHLLRTLCRAWRGPESERKTIKERLMSQLPWEEYSLKSDMLPAEEALRRLALNESGFVFDPGTGRSFTANETGLYVLRFLQHSTDLEALEQSVMNDFSVEAADARKDIADFLEQLRKFLA